LGEAAMFRDGKTLDPDIAGRDGTKASDIVGTVKTDCLFPHAGAESVAGGLHRIFIGALT
jgi:hypothetical protein